MKKIFLWLFFILLSVVAYVSVSATSLFYASDQLSTSIIATSSNHTVSFITAQAIPASGKIIITPEAGFFDISTGFDEDDMDLSVADSISGTSTDRILSSSTDLFRDIVNIATGTSGYIEIILNSISGIDANKFVKIELGTNASFEATSTNQILNPGSLGAYKLNIKTYDDSSNLLDRVDVMIATTNLVTVFANPNRIRYNGSPTGVLLQGTEQTVLSMTTNYLATCRYSTASGTPYDSISNTFINTGENYHSSVIDGLLDANTYVYYVRCLDENLVPDLTDYVIEFAIESAGTGDGGTGTGSSSGSGGGTAGVSGTGAGTSGDNKPNPPLPEVPLVELVGWAYPGADVTILQDGEVAQEIKASAEAEFNSIVDQLQKGAYTFGIWAQDSDGIKSIIRSYTFWIKEETRTLVSDIFIPPTLSIDKGSYSVGELIQANGQSIPGSQIEAWLYPQKSDLTEEEIFKIQAIVPVNGKWEISFDTSQLTNGAYSVKARSNYSTIGYSDFSKLADCSIGGEPLLGPCERSDLNKDGKVNLIDFSIMLYHWETEHSTGDINSDGKVNLIDFSIMLYCWTG